MPVVVVGGGVAGLVVARDLAVAGRDVVLLEAGPRVGGTVAGHEVAGLRLDAGAESFATRSTGVAELLADLGLGDDVVAPEPLGAWLQLPDRAVPLPHAGVLGIPSRPWAADVRRVVGTAGAVRATLDRVLPARVGTGEDADLHALVRSRMGRRVADLLVAPVAGGVHSTHPSRLTADVVPGLRTAVRRSGSLAGAVRGMRAAAPAGAAVAGLRGGMHRMVEALVAEIGAHGGTIRTESPAHGLRRTGDRWHVTTSAGVVTADHVVLAVPGQAAVPLLDAPEGLPAAAATGEVVLATLVVDLPALDAAPRGTGVLVAEGAPVVAKALTHATAKWAWLAAMSGRGRHVLRLSYGAADRPLPESAREGGALLELARRDAGALLGVAVPDDAVLGFARTVWAPPRPVGPRPPAVVDGVRVTGSWAAGTGLASVVPHARATAAAVIASDRNAAG